MAVHSFRPISYEQSTDSSVYFHIIKYTFPLRKKSSARRTKRELFNMTRFVHLK